MTYFLATLSLLAAILTSQMHVSAAAPEQIWRSLEKLPSAEREMQLIEGAKKEGEMIWYTNTGAENANLFIQAFKKFYPFINARFWRSKTRQVVQRVVAEARAGRHLVDIIEPSTDLVPTLLEAKVLGRYESPARSVYPALTKGAYYSTTNYAFRIFSYNPRKLARKEVPKSWEELLQSRWKGQILFDAASLDEVVSLIAAWGRDRTSDYFIKLSQQQLLIRVGRDTTTQLMMAGEAPLAITTYASNSEHLKTTNAPVDWVAEDLIPTLIYPLTAARNAPHPHSAALFYDFLLSERGQQLFAAEGRVVAHPKIDPIYPRLKELRSYLGSYRVQLNTVEQNHKLYNDGLQILDEIILQRKG
jgi:ABC-type Fe3+ transport system substrate-binding protein